MPDRLAAEVAYARSDADALAAENRRLVSLVKKMRAWALCPECGWMVDTKRDSATSCGVCGPLADLLTELEKR